MKYTKKLAAFTTEIEEIMGEFPDDMHVGRFLVEHPERGKRLIWLLIASGQEVTDRVLFHCGWDHPQQVRDEAWGTDFWPDKMIPGDRLYERWLAKQGANDVD